MLVLQECIVKLEKFKETFSQKFGITKLGIFGSVARKRRSHKSLVSLNLAFSVLLQETRTLRIVILISLWRCRSQHFALCMSYKKL